MSNHKYLFKIVVLGDAGVGKTCLLRRFIEDRFSLQYTATVGLDFNVCQVDVSGEVVHLQIWDTAGEERFRAMLPSYYRRAHGIIVVYDTTSAESFANVEQWLTDIAVICPEGVDVMLVGNKCDDLDRRQVSQEHAARYAEHCDILFMETSAMSGVNVKDLFGTLAVEIFTRLVLAIKLPSSAKSDKSRESKKSKERLEAGKEEGEAGGDGDGEGDGDSEGDGNGDDDDDDDDDGDGDGDGDDDDDGDGDGDNDDDDDDDDDDDGDGEGDCEGKNEGDGVGDGKADGEGNGIGDGDVQPQNPDTIIVLESKKAVEEKNSFCSFC